MESEEMLPQAVWSHTNVPLAQGETILGAGSGLSEVMSRVEVVARAEVPVVLQGETGSGKEVVARAIHARSRRQGGPFLRVNCGAIAPELVDSELFGHERGSFTGATALRKGWFERADSGTLFLDECGELTPAAQVRLLRVLQDGTFERVGGEKQIQVNVRVIAATHRDLQAMVAAGSFREDLWYRLAVFPIAIPALRDRPQDIVEMATHFAAAAAARLGLPNCTAEPEDLAQLVNHPWPGNVRQLASVMERAVLLGCGRRIDIAGALDGGARQTAVKLMSNVDVAAPVSPPAPSAAKSHSNANDSTVHRSNPHGSSMARPQSDDFATLDVAISQHIAAALRRTGGRIEGPHGAAALLDINPHTLRARMKKLNIDWGSFRNS